jgi:ribonuclease D
LENPDQIKIMHGADYDLISLRRDFGFRTRGLFDTLVAARFLNFERVGLADLVDAVFGVYIEKKYQRHDWSERPLKPEHLEYARGDTHYLLALREYLVRRLDRSGRAAASDEECLLLEQRDWKGRQRTEADFLRVKGAGALTEGERRVLRALWVYRDEQAKAIDRPAFKVIPDRVLLDLSQGQPTTVEGLAAFIRPTSSLTRRHGKALAKAVRDGLEDSRPLPVPPRRSRAITPLPRRAEPLMEVLKSWRNRKVDLDGLPPMLVASNSVLREIARAAPKNVEELSAIEVVRVWQVEAYGEELVELCVAPAPKLSATGTGRPRKRRRNRKKSDEDEAAASE